MRARSLLQWVFTFLFVEILTIDVILGNIFTYDRKALNEEFSEIQYIEEILLKNGEVSEPVIGNYAEKINYKSVGVMEPPLGIPSILWGLLLNFIGVIIVWIATYGDEYEIRNSLIGCILGTALFGTLGTFGCCLWLSLLSY